MDILIAEGDDAIRQAERDILEEAGYTIIEARTGAEALAALRASPHALVALIDGMLPGIGGVRVLSAACRDMTLAHHGYVFLSTLSPSRFPWELWDTLRDLSAAVIEKPFDLDVFTGTVAAVTAQLRSVAVCHHAL